MKYKEVTLEELTTPKTGKTVICDHWWITSNGNPVFYIARGFNSPQCNADKRIVDMMLSKNKFLENADSIFIPVAYVDRTSQ